MTINTDPSDGHPRSFRVVQNLRLARHWVVLLQHPLHPTALPSLSCPFLIPDLLRQGRLAGILCSPRSNLDALWPGSGPSLGVWRWRSRDGVQAKQTWRSSNVATEPGQHSPRPLSQGEGGMVPYKHHLARSHILILRFWHSLPSLRSWSLCL